MIHFRFFYCHNTNRKEFCVLLFYHSKSLTSAANMDPNHRMLMESKMNEKPIMLNNCSETKGSCFGLNYRL